MSKDRESLEKSREIRAAVIMKYGCVPTSVWEIDYSWGKHIIEYDGRKQDNIALDRHRKMWADGVYDPSLHDAFNMSSKNVRGKGKDAGLSTFPPALCKRGVLFYSEEGEWVLDPCAGHNSRMQVTYELNRNYIGYDVSKEFMNFNREVREKIMGGGEQGLLFSRSNKIILREQSSEHMKEGNESVDFVFTSPPYWCVEWYGDEPEQLGLNTTYEQFLSRMQLIINEAYRVLKQGKFCAININDFRHKGVFYAYHADIMNILRQSGFTLWDCIIVKWKSVLGSCFASQVEERKICAKGHEYLVVGKKV